jgi:hypothetical protein
MATNRIIDGRPGVRLYVLDTGLIESADFAMWSPNARVDRDRKAASASPAQRCGCTTTSMPNALCAPSLTTTSELLILDDLDHAWGRGECLNRASRRFVDLYAWLRGRRLLVPRARPVEAPVAKHHSAGL